MRLLYLSPDAGVPVLGHKGASVHVREIARALIDAGAFVAVASPSVAPRGDVLEPDVELIEIPAIVPGREASAASVRAAMDAQTERVAELARSRGITAICERHSLLSWAGVRAARALGLPHVLEVNSPLREEAARFRSLLHPTLAAAVEAEVYGATDRVFAVSSVLAELLTAEGVDPAKVEVLPNGVAAERFPPRNVGPREDVSVGFAGSLKPWHGVEVLLEAFTLALQRQPHLRLEMVGTGPLARALGETDLPAGRFMWHGALPHRATIEVMSGWDIGVAPYLALPRFYFSPLKVGEYMAAGCCPVASDLGDLRGLLSDGHGLLVPAGDSRALAGALCELASDRARATAIGTRARARARASLSWARNADRILAALRGVPAGALP
jgi:glycosyltransferase involved in cell wall biosynthesis